MAGASVTRRNATAYFSGLTEIKATVNRLVDDLELLRAQYVLHQHAALNAAPSTNTVAAASLTAYKVLDA